jgi:hypothetical protein
MRGRAGFRVLLLLAAAAAAPASAWAQAFDVAESPTTRCLTVAAGEPDAPTYPFDEFKRDERGAVQVLLEFTSADTPPRVTVQERTSQPFADAVVAHARHLRVPCMEAGSPPVRLIRDYVFVPDGHRVRWHRAVDADAEAHRAAWACVKHVDGQKRPQYPRRALEAGVQGRVVARVRFEGPDKPPVVRVHARRTAALLAGAVEDWLSDTRMPCYPGRPFSTNVTFVYTVEGERAFGFRELPFRTLLAATAGIERQTLAVDTTTMGCPFEVQFTYRQPHLPNHVGEVGDRDPARRLLLEWLETVEFKLPDRALDSIYGDSTMVTIPCIRLDLKPKE